MPENSHTAPGALRISTFGMDPRIRNSIELFFRHLCNGQYLLTEDETADIAIVDVDSVEGSRHYDTLMSRYPEKTILVVSVLEPESPPPFFLKKPLQPAELSAILAKMRNSLERRQFQEPELRPSVIRHVTPAPTAAVEPPPSPAPPRELRPTPERISEEPASGSEIVSLFPDLMPEPPRPPSPSPPPLPFADGSGKEKNAFFYDPSSHLQGYLERAYRLACDKNRNVLLKGPWRPIIILPETREFWVEQKHTHLYSMAVVRIQPGDVSFRILGKNDSPPEQRGSIQPLEPFLWKLTIRTARGRIPAGTDPHHPVSLSRWPNLSRLTPISHGLRIASLWTREPTSLTETAKRLDIEPKFVFSFYSAVRALGLVEEGKPPPMPQRPKPAAEKETTRSLFRKILARLRGRNTDDQAN